MAPPPAKAEAMNLSDFVLERNSDFEMMLSLRSLSSD